MASALLLGAVAYDPKVVRNGFRAWFRERRLPLNDVLYSNYERQVGDPSHPHRVGHTLG